MKLWDPISWFGPAIVLCLTTSGPGFPTSYVVFSLCVQLVEMRCDCSFCWYWWNWWPSLFKLAVCSVSSVNMRGDCWFYWYWWNWWPSPSFHKYHIIAIIYYMNLISLLEEFEDTKGVIIIRKSTTDRQHNDKKGQTTNYKTLHMKLKI